MTRTKKKRKKTGPKDRYTEEMSERCYRLALLGLTDALIANVIGISQWLLDKWKVDHPAFLENLTKGKRDADANVAEALYHKAIGYSHDDVHIMANRVNEYKDGELVRSYVKPLMIPIVKHYPPDSKAGSFFLKNRTRDMENPWSDRFELTSRHTGGANINLLGLDMSDFDEAELALLLKLSKKLNVPGKEEEE